MAKGTEMIQMQITLPENVMDAIRAEAAQISVTPNVLARIRLCTLFSGNGTGAEKKSYVVTLGNWQEAEAYVKAKYPGSTVGDFAVKAIFSEMKKHSLKSAQKDEFDRLVGR
jgi:hypothetical protein